VGAALLAVAGAVTAWFFFLRPFSRPDFLPLCLSEYGDEFPVRAWVRKDLDALRQLSWGGKNTFDRQISQLFLEELKDFTDPEHPHKVPAVLYLSGIVLPGPGEELYLLPVDASLDRPGTWIPLRKVFESLRACKAPHKVLLLDVMQPSIDPPRGLIINDAAERLDPILKKAVEEDTKLHVLCACSPGQMSLPAEELGQSVFVCFLCQGMHGRADGVGGKRDGRVTLQELAAYVQDRVDRWTLHYRGVRQTPRLYGSRDAKDDFPLAGARETGPETPPELQLAGEYPPWLTGAWKGRQDNWDAGTFREQPYLFGKLDTYVLRAEHQWRGGIDAESELDSRLRGLQKDLAAQRGATPRLTSMAQVLAREGKADTPLSPAEVEAIRDLQSLASRAVELAATPNKEAEKLMEEESAKILKKPPFDKEPARLGRVLLEAAAAEPAPQPVLRFYNDLARKSKLPRWTETDFLNRLAGLNPAADPESAQLALQLTVEVERVAAADRSTLRWVADQRTQADELGAAALAAFPAADPAARTKVTARLHEALRAYQAIDKALRVVREAQLAWDEARVLLPELVPYLVVLEDEPEGGYKAAVKAACGLRDLLAPSPDRDRDERIRQLPAATADLQKEPNSLNKLRSRLAEEPFKKLIGPSASLTPADAKLIMALLETPCLSVAQRTELWSARHNLAVARRDRPQDAGALPSFDEKQAAVAEYRRALRRARLAMEELRLQGFDGLAKLEEVYQRAAAQTTAGRPMQDLCEALRNAWQKQPKH
jgi:hypothetical protein